MTVPAPFFVRKGRDEGGFGGIGNVLCDSFVVAIGKKCRFFQKIY